MDSDLKDLEFDVTVYGEDLSELNPSNSDDYFDNYSRAIEWNNGNNILATHCLFLIDIPIVQCFS